VTVAPLLPPDDLTPQTRALLSRRGVREALERLRLHPSRRLGQHFLVEPAALHRILEAAELTGEDAVLEIGPGLGVLTSELLRRAGRVVAVELDRRLCASLRERFAGVASFTLVEGDVLKLDLGQLMTGAGAGAGESRRYKVVANLPYGITSAALRHLLEARPAPSRLVLMVQLEVARRVTAAPPEMSLLALSVRYYAQPKIVARVPAGCFLPPPQVDSAVLCLEVSAQPRVDVPAESFFRLVRAGFLHPRRQLGNNLAAGLDRPREEVRAALDRAGVAPQRRPETLSLEDWAAVYREIRLGL